MSYKFRPCCSYASIYSYRFINEGGSWSKTQTNACFATIFNKLGRLNNTFECKILMYYTSDYSEDNSKNHYCLFTEREIKNYLRQLRYYLPKIKFKLRNDIGEERFILSVGFERESKMKVMFALTWIRHLWEFPYNVILKDAIRMRQELSKYSVLDYFIMLCNTSPAHNLINTGHTFAEYAAPYFSRKIVKRYLTSETRLNNIFQTFDRKRYMSVEDSSIRLLSYWRDDEEYLKRKHYCLKQFNIKDNGK